MDLKKMIKQTMPARKRIIVSSIFIFFVLAMVARYSGGRYKPKWVPKGTDDARGPVEYGTDLDYRRFNARGMDENKIYDPTKMTKGLSKMGYVGLSGPTGGYCRGRSFLRGDRLLTSK